jgi:prefoldin subunit 5
VAYAADPFFLTYKEDSTISKKTRPNYDKETYKMYGSQIERLKRDSRELKHYMRKIENKGDKTLLFKLQKKHDYLESRIYDIQEELNHTTTA